MKKIFIDCGSYDGCSIRKFRDLYDKDNEYTIYSFETNPYLQKYYEQKYENHIHYNKAVWIYDGIIDFFVFKHTGGSTLDIKKAKHNRNKRKKKMKIRNIDLPEEKIIKIECIDLSKWIKDNFDKEDHIILKLDVEGSEYDILNKLFEDNIINYINQLFIEFHNIRCGKTLKDDKNILQKLSEKNIKYDDTWDSMHSPYLIENIKY